MHGLAVEEEIEAVGDTVSQLINESAFYCGERSYELVDLTSHDAYLIFNEQTLIASSEDDG